MTGPERLQVGPAGVKPLAAGPSFVPAATPGGLPLRRGPFTLPEAGFRTIDARMTVDLNGG